MRRHHGLIGNIADKVTKHKELKHQSRLYDDLARGDLMAADYHAAKANQWGGMNDQVNAPRGGVVGLGMAPVQSTLTTTTFIQPTYSTIQAPVMAPVPIHTQAGFLNESHNVTSQSNGNFYHSESKTVRSPTGVHKEHHEVVDQRHTPVPAMMAGGSGFQNQVSQQQLIHQNVQPQARLAASPQIVTRSDSHHKETVQTTTNLFTGTSSNSHHETKHSETTQQTANPFLAGVNVKKDSYFSKSSDVNDGFHGEHHSEHQEQHHTRY